MKVMCENSCIQLKLNLDVDKKHDMVAIPVAQFTVGNCEENNLLCGNKGGYFLTVRRLYCI